MDSLPRVLDGLKNRNKRKKREHTLNILFFKTRNPYGAVRKSLVILETSQFKQENKSL